MLIFAPHRFKCCKTFLLLRNVRFYRSFLPFLDFLSVTKVELILSFLTYLSHPVHVLGSAGNRGFRGPNFHGMSEEQRKVLTCPEFRPFCNHVRAYLYGAHDRLSLNILSSISPHIKPKAVLASGF